jgi:hypothetical protein
VERRLGRALQQRHAPLLTAAAACPRPLPRCRCACAVWESDGTPFTGSTENRLIIKPYTQQLKLQTEDKY